MSESGFSWGDLIRNFRSVFGGAAAFLFAMYLLLFNETDSKTHTDALDQAIGSIVEAGNGPVTANEGKLVAARGEVTAQSGVEDPEFDVKSDGVGLQREVSMYQWVEYEESEGTGRRRRTTYRYEKEFSSVYHNSSRFDQPAGHENPPQLLKSQIFVASDAKLGNFDISDPALISTAFPSEHFQDRGVLQGDLSEWPVAKATLPPLGPHLQSDGWMEFDGSYYNADPDAEEYKLGDLIVSYYELPQQQSITAFGQQAGNTIKPWKADSGETLYAVVMGANSGKQLLMQELQLTNETTGFMRWFGVLIAALGFGGMASALGGFLRGIPIIGSVVEFSLFLAGAIIGAILGVFAIILGWFAARPIVSVLIIGSIVGAIIWRAKVSGAQQKIAEESDRIARASAIAKQRQSERQNAGTPPPPPLPSQAARGALDKPFGAPPPPPTAANMTPPPSSMPAGVRPPTTLPSGIQAPVLKTPDPNSKVALQPAPVPPADMNGDLPALEWTPSSYKAPPAVMPKKVQAEPSAPPFDSVPFEPSVKTAPIGSATPHVAAITPTSPSAANSGAAPAKGKAKRVEIGQKDGFTLTKIERVDGDQAGEIICFELLQDKEVLARGTQDEIKRALAAQLSARRA